MNKFISIIIAATILQSCSSQNPNPNNNKDSTTTLIPFAPSKLTGVLESSSQAYKAKAQKEIEIGKQVWMTRNLDVTAYRNGDPIPYVTDVTVWAGLTTGAWCYYNYDPSNGSGFGKLYNWYAVSDPRGLAPIGWHVPSDVEWTTLETTLGGRSVAGGKMKVAGVTSCWNEPNTGADNSSGFAGLPGGYRNFNGSFGNIGYGGYWWSSTENTTRANAWNRSLYYYFSSVAGGKADEKDGFSVRCIKD